MTRAVTAPTIRHVAEAAGVSIKTVSRVMNAEANVRPDTAERVRVAAAELGYAVNVAARQLAGGRARSIGVLVASSRGWHWTADLIGAALARAQSHGYALAPHVITQFDGREREQLLALAARRGVDGLLLTPPWGEVPTLHEVLEQAGVPFVLLPAPVGSGRAGVRADDREGLERLTCHLIALGHRRISVVAGQRRLDLTRQRLAGFRQAMEQAGLAWDAVPHVFADYTAATGLAALDQLLAGPVRPTAVIAFTDLLAAGILRRAHERGLSVPGDLSVAGVGNLSLAQLTWPALTTLSIPSEDMASAAVDLLVEMIEQRRAPREVVFHSRLVERETLGPA